MKETDFEYYRKLGLILQKIGSENQNKNCYLHYPSEKEEQRPASLSLPHRINFLAFLSCFLCVSVLQIL